jgi:hypothetical protein
MAITYTVAEYTAEDRTVEVTFENSEGLIHKRTINIPHNEDGTIDEDYFQEILEGQLRGVENKLRVGAVTFTEPEPTPEPLTPPEPVGIATT